MDIPAGDLTAALEALARQSGTELLYNPDQLKGLRTEGVKGVLSAEEAVAQLLRGTELTHHVDESGIVLIAEDAAAGVRAIGGTRVAQVEKRQAGETEAASGKDRDEGKLEEIVVTAQKREERLQDVPLSVSVLGAEDIERRGLVSRADYMRTVPSMLLREDGVGLAEIVVRGAYADRFNTGPTVGLYFGDVPLTGYALGGSTDIKLIDIERVEVLRGPQGSLYGSNALSGAVRYIPAKPDLQDLAGRVSLEYSRARGEGGDGTAAEGVLNLPLVQDKLALRAVAFRHESDGYIQNIAGSDPIFQATAASFGATDLAVDQHHLGGSEYLGGRISALWQATDAFSLNLTYFKQQDSQDDRLFELQPSGPYRRTTYRLPDFVGGDKDALVVDVDILNLTAEYDLGWGNLYSSSAWLDQRFIRKWDIGSLLSGTGPLMPAPQTNRTDAEVFAQELRFASRFDGRFDVVAGLYYEDSETPSTQGTFFGGDPAFNPFSNVVLWQTTVNRIVDQKALFGEVSYDITDALELTLGGRAFEYDTHFTTIFFNSSVPFVGNSISDSHSEESGRTAKAGLEYKPSENGLFYATWSQGFRLGQPLPAGLLQSACDDDGNLFLDGTDIPANLERFDSDRLDSYELGGKVSLLAGRLNLSTALYHNDWTDVPVRATGVVGCPQQVFVNGGSARARGVETEGNLRLTADLRLNFGLGYVDSELTATTSAGTNGMRMNFTPEFNGNLGLEYGFSLLERAGFVRADYTYFGSYYTQTGERGLRADGYSLVNLRAGWNVTERGELQLRIDNVLDSDALTAVIGPSSFPPGYGLRLAPRTIGLGLSYSF